MAKYSKKKKKKSSAGLNVLLIVLAVLLAAMIGLIGILKQREIPLLEMTEPTAEATQAAAEQTQEAEEAPEETQAEASGQFETVNLAMGLQLLHIGKYTGMYMEDGTNETVTNVMMVILENTGDQDLQLARIYIEYPEFTAEFEATNLPAGEKVVLLEKNRQEITADAYTGIQVKNVVYYSEPMSLQEERIQIEGGKGNLKVTNISEEDITGDIYIYYKHSASDLLYGGITYRVTVRGGLAAGESSSVIAGHYSPDTCRLLLVEG